MKKTPLLFVLVLICAAFSSCINIPLTFKENLSELPKTESSIVTFENTMTGFYFVTSTRFILKKWNGNEINKTLHSAFIPNKNRAEITVPPGSNSFTFDVFFDNRGYSNIELQYNLEAGKKYIVKARVNTITSVDTTSGMRVRKLEYFIGIYLDVRNSEPLREWKIG